MAPFTRHSEVHNLQGGAATPPRWRAPFERELAAPETFQMGSAQRTSFLRSFCRGVDSGVAPST